jgi:hypothetical protein
MTNINWARVEEAMARSKRGHGSDADYALCKAAFEADRKTYSEVNKRVIAAVHRSMNPMLAGKEPEDT